MHSLSKKRLAIAITLALGITTACTDVAMNDASTKEQAQNAQTSTTKPNTPLPQPQIQPMPEMEEHVAMHDASVDVAFAAQPTNRMGKALMVMPGYEPYPQAENRDNYIDTPSNGVHQVSTTPLSTFSIDVDTGSYANVRSYLTMGQKPPTDAIREEAFINYFDYNYATPNSTKQPFSVNTEIAPSPWNVERQLLRIALKGYDIPKAERKASNLVFLVDVSGSMAQPNKLPLLVQSLSMLTKELGENDTVSLVTYAGNASVVLKPTKGDNTQAILNALKSLNAGGGTYGESGIKLAYQQAQQGFIKGGVNRVILATDGDFNLGVTNMDELKDIITAERKKGVSLTTLGFGRGNYNDALMEQLANTGDGNHAYIDTLHEAQKVLLRQMSGTLQSIASDVKIQVEFNPANVKEYRLIGYQNRKLRDEDFNNDKVDAGEIGAGHTVTALYELTLTGDQGQIDDLRYQQKEADVASSGSHSNELAHVKVRYKLPGTATSTLVEGNVNQNDIKKGFTHASADFKFATAVAAFAQKLKENSYLDDFDYAQIATIARENRGDDPYNYRGEFVRLVEVAQSL
ncbi:vWA domain-containing protein [Enterovibrio norvegicus]|uniref:Ca-activated chloride channel family protein n=1 Tax=Enterovibrio norvegicus DSM 15893 TaxID=1121869 RepID=A0A1I5V2X2_9GAMM|nr:VWA domain-containing protein [Enterovibrio norvegicus]SFQ01667.1 Ca-activated chloride channel family protein [Enterovibrio norvegicus DSM 15893]